MSTLQCQRLGGAVPECAVHGTCFGSACVCDKGWGKSTELALYLSQEEFDIGNSGADPNTNNLICDTHEASLRVLYSGTLFFVVTAFMFQARKIKKWKHIKTLSAYFLCTLCSAIFCLMKLIDIDRKVGQDIAITFLWAALHVSGNISVLWYNNRFIRYQAKAASKFIHLPKFDTKYLKFVQKVLTCLDSLVGILMFSSSLVSTLVTAKRLFLAAFGVYFSRSFYQLWATEYFTKYVIHDLDLVLNGGGK